MFPGLSEKIELNEGNAFHKYWKSKLKKLKKEKSTLCRKLTSLLIQIVFFLLISFTMVYSFLNEWIILTNGCVMFLCLYIYEFFNLVPIMMTCCKKKMINIAKLIFYLMVCVIFIFLSQTNDESKPNFIEESVFGTLFGFFLSVVISIELKHFCIKILN